MKELVERADVLELFGRMTRTIQPEGNHVLHGVRSAAMKEIRSRYPGARTMWFGGDDLDRAWSANGTK